MLDTRDLGQEEILNQLKDTFLEQLNADSAQESIIEMAREAVKKNHVTLVLGAGSSASANIPGWEKLLSQILGYAMQYNALARQQRNEPEPLREARLEQALILKKLKISMVGNNLEAGQYLKQLLDFSDPKFAEERIKTIIAYIIGDAETPEQFLRRKVSEINKEEPNEEWLRRVAETETLPAVVYLLKKTRRAITYDYHTLVQDYLINVFGVNESEIVTHPGQWNEYDEPDKIQIFHVHGFIPDRGKAESPAYPQKSEKLILTEDSYKTMAQIEEYNWANSIQSYYLNRDNCIFIGFSGDDYNFRRLICQLGRTSNRPEHYLFFVVDDLIESTFQSVRTYREQLDNDQEEIKKDTLCILNNILDRKLKYWKRYNIIPIWTTRNQIPLQLVSLV